MQTGPRVWRSRPHSWIGRKEPRWSLCTLISANKISNINRNGIQCYSSAALNRYQKAISNIQIHNSTSASRLLGVVVLFLFFPLVSSLWLFGRLFVGMKRGRWWLRPSIWYSIWFSGCFIGCRGASKRSLVPGERPRQHLWRTERGEGIGFLIHLLLRDRGFSQ